MTRAPPAGGRARFPAGSLQWRRRSPSVSAACPCRGDFQYGAPAGITELLIVDVQAAETVDLGGLARQQQVGSVDCASRSPGRRCGRRRRAGRDRRSGRRPCRQPARSADAEAKVPPLRMEIVKRSDDMKGFVVLPRRWFVERTLLVRTQPASRQGFRESCGNSGHLRDPRFHPAHPHAVCQR